MSLLPLPVMILAACASPQPLALADAGSAVYGLPGDHVYLDGGDSFGASLSWQFQQLPMFSQLGQADLYDADTAWPYFAPDVDGYYSIELLACDVQDVCATDSVTVPVGVHARPMVRAQAQGWGQSGRLGPWEGNDSDNSAPSAVATSRRTLAGSGLVLLDGSGSDDEDGDSLTWRWAFAYRPAGSTLRSEDIRDRDLAEASFVPDVAGEYGVRLRVGDGHAADAVLLPIVVEDRLGEGWEPIPD